MLAAPVSPADAPEGPQTAAQDMDDFIYLISHDIRASVRALLELPKWIVEDLTDAGVQTPGSVAQTVEMMTRHAARLDRMLIDLLAYSRIGRMHDPEQVDLAEVLEEAVEGIALPEGMQLSRDIACRDSVMARQDALMLWGALISNAVKHHHRPSGQIIAATRAEGETVRLSVCDDGPGIPEQFHAKMLGAMTTLRPRDEVEGTGMGLAHVSKIAAHYGGSVRLCNRQEGGGGLRIDVVLPCNSAGLKRPETDQAGLTGCPDTPSI